ncbi:MAG: hypothetical protein OXJ52_05440 [Oligoflexia bacterium]|nr:hypothetical protein [Oligoflexia bacterium]
MSVDDFHFDQRDKNLLNEIKKFITRAIKPITKDIKAIKDEHSKLIKELIEAGLLRAWTSSRSLKQVTERGYKLLNKHNTDSYLDSNCELLRDKELKNKTDVEIFIKCLDWVKKQGQEKAIELRLNSNINEEQCNELLSLAIMEKIKSTS